MTHKKPGWWTFAWNRAWVYQAVCYDHLYGCRWLVSVKYEKNSRTDADETCLVFQTFFFPVQVFCVFSTTHVDVLSRKGKNQKEGDEFGVLFEVLWWSRWLLIANKSPIKGSNWFFHDMEFSTHHSKPCCPGWRIRQRRWRPPASGASI